MFGYGPEKDMFEHLAHDVSYFSTQRKVNHYPLSLFSSSSIVNVNLKYHTHKHTHTHTHMYTHTL